ncbi:hypothetical protein D3Z47_04480 [Lachnospiraceae bacterium]|nr:hypothetical protein [Lachnospiraceae bacterium]
MVSIEAEFAEQIMIDLITQGYSGNELQEHFRKEVSQICPAIKEMLADTKKAVVEKASEKLLTILEEGELSVKERGWMSADEVEEAISNSL